MDHRVEFQAAARRCEPGLAGILGETARLPVRKLKPDMWTLIQTARGPILADDNFERFKPTIDLVSIALEVADVVETDAYRVSGLTVATELYPVWLTPTDSAALERALKRVRACVSIRGELDPAAGPTARDQQLLVFLAETKTPAEARLIAAAAVPTETHEAFGLAEATACCVIVANSFTFGVETSERSGALARFEAPLRSVLRQAQAPD
jgi:hypothetical protein